MSSKHKTTRVVSEDGVPLVLFDVAQRTRRGWASNVAEAECQNLMSLREKGQIPYFV